MRPLPWLLVLCLFCTSPARAAEQDEATRLLTEAKALREKGRYVLALPLAQRAVVLREREGDQLRLAEALDEAGWIGGERGSSAEIEQTLQRALRIREAALAPDHADIGISLLHLGRVLRERGDYGKAEQVLDRALRILEAALGPDHPKVARVLDLLGTLYRIRGELNRGEQTLRRALAICERSRNPDPATYGFVLMDLQHFLTDYDEKDQLLRRAISIFETHLGPTSAHIGTALHTLANNSLLRGDLEQAGALFQRALSIKEQSLGPVHPNAALTRSQLGSLERSRGAYDRAAPYYLRSIPFLEGLSLALAVHGLGEVYRQSGQLERAEPMFRQALALHERAGPVHPRVAEVLNSQALVHHARGELEKAEPLYQRAIAIREDIPWQFMDVPLALSSYASLLLTQGRNLEALPLLRRILRLNEARLRTEARTLSEARLLAVLELMRRDEEVLYAYALREPGRPEAQQLALATALLRKGRTLDEVAGTSQVIARSLSGEDQKLFAELRAHYGRLASLAAAGPGQVAGAQHQAQLQKLSARKDWIEQELATRSHRIKEQRQLPGPDQVMARAAARLPADGALIEYVVARDIGPRLARGPEHLLVLVLLPDGKTAAVDLGPQAAVAGAARRLVAALQDPRAPYAIAAQEVARLVMAPLRSHLAGRRQLFVSTEGPLHFVPFAALSDGQGPLLGRYEFTYLTSGRDLLRKSDAQPAMTVALLADPLFAHAAVGSAGPSSRATTRRDRALVLGNLAPLPGTRQEAQAIRAMLPAAKLLLGAEASEGALLDLKAPGILHVATHGIFVSEEAQPAASQRGFRAQGTTPTNPMLRSALVLAGAQAQQKGEGADGLATALELSGMDLWGTQLVVLSACETGRGDARQGQGVYGLRRALSIAGAETLVTSLWKVDDATTKDLMTDYYRGLVSGNGRGDAMTAAMTKMRARKPHPYYWAPFIVIGQPGPLRGIGVP